MKKYILFFLLISCASEESRLADTYYQNKNYNKAIESYEKAKEIYPTMKSPDMMIDQIKELIKKQSI